MAAKLPEATRRPWTPPTPREVEVAQILGEGRAERMRQATERRQRAAEALARLKAGEEAPHVERQPPGLDVK